MPIADAAVPVGLAAMGFLALALAVLVRDYRHAARTKALHREVERLCDERWELSEALERTRALLDAQGDMVVVRDAAGRIEHVNEAYGTLSGMEGAALIGTDHRPVAAMSDEPAVGLDGSRQYDQRITTPYGDRWVAWRETTLRDAQGRVVSLTVGRDITERVTDALSLSDARERAEGASRSKSRFLAAMSHEIRTPVAGMLGMANLLVDTPLQPDQRSYVQAIKTSGESLIAIIGEILDFSKIEAGKLELESQPFDLAGLVEGVTELLAPRAQAKGIELVTDIDESLPSRVLGDATRLRQVLVNLLGNAVKFTETGGVSLILTPEADGKICFCIEDTGIGIDAAALARIFSEFEQADNSISRKHGGTGLGLAISHRIVGLMGGRIEVESTPGQGSIFRFVIQLPTDEAALPFEVPVLAGQEVLIVSPSPVLGPLLTRRLCRWQAQVRHVGTLAAAREEMTRRPYASLIVDRALGREACEALAREGSAGRRVLLLAPAERLELQELIEAGFDAYLVKPIRAISLAQRIIDKAPALVPQADEPDTDSPVAAVPSAPPQSALSILVAEDNPINAMLARALVSNLGHKVTLANDGAEAVAAYQTAVASGQPFDLVLMDMQMPQVDGLEATRRIRALEPEGTRVPIHALTANAFPEDAEACRAVGMDGFLVKPLDKERLEDLVTAFTSGHPALQAAR